jgi:hypothetical protein
MKKFTILLMNTVPPESAFSWWKTPLLEELMEGHAYRARPVGADSLSEAVLQAQSSTPEYRAWVLGDLVMNYSDHQIYVLDSIQGLMNVTTRISRFLTWNHDPVTSSVPASLAEEILEEEDEEDDDDSCADCSGCEHEQDHDVDPQQLPGKTFERSDMQPLITQAVSKVFEEAGIPVDKAHTRRKIRSLLRLGIAEAFQQDWRPDEIASVLHECFHKEAREAGIQVRTSEIEIASKTKKILVVEGLKL